MSAHRVLRDLYRAFESVGVGVGNDPGDAGTIKPVLYGQVYPIVTAAAETRILAQPSRPGILTTVVLSEDSDDLTLTVTGGYNNDDDTSITFDDAGDFVTFMSIQEGTSFYWRAIGQEGTTAAIETLTVDTIVVPTVAAEHGAGVIGTALDPVTKRYQIGGTIITEFYIDLTGLASIDDADDIIGLAAGGDAYIGRHVAATSGYPFKVEMICIESPATGDDDINLVSGTASDDAYNDPVTAAGVVINGGAWSGSSRVIADDPDITTNDYLYLTCGAGDTGGTYTAGQFLIRIHGTPYLS